MSKTRRMSISSRNAYIFNWIASKIDYYRQEDHDFLYANDSSVHTAEAVLLGYAGKCTERREHVVKATAAHF
jgi:hypothetical protein